MDFGPSHRAIAEIQHTAESASKLIVERLRLEAFLMETGWDTSVEVFSVMAAKGNRLLQLVLTLTADDQMGVRLTVRLPQQMPVEQVQQRLQGKKLGLEQPVTAIQMADGRAFLHTSQTFSFGQDLRGLKLWINEVEQLLQVSSAAELES